MILSCGEAVVDVLPDGNERLGGSPFNVARGLGRLGESVGYLGALSTDAMGDAFLRELLAAGVSLKLVQRDARPTLRATVSIAGGEVHFLFTPEDSADRHLTEPSPKLLDEVAAVHVGSLALGRKPGADVLDALVLGYSGFVSLDPNVRLSVIEEPLAWRRRVREISARADLVKMSAEDAAVLFPGISEASLADEILADGACAVVLTRGASGATCHLRAGCQRVAAAPVAVLDTVGAGDSFMAGLLAGLREAHLLERGVLGRCPPEALFDPLRLACACAALSCTRSGPYAPTRDQAEELLGHIRSVED